MGALGVRLAMHFQQQNKVKNMQTTHTISPSMTNMLKGEPHDDLCITSEYGNGDWIGNKGGRDDIFAEQWAGGGVKCTYGNDGANMQGDTG
jgi:hypothetical protein